MLCVLGGVGAEHANGHCAEALAVRTARCDFHIAFKDSMSEASAPDRLALPETCGPLFHTFIFKDSMSQVSAPDRLALPETCGPLLRMFASVPFSLWGGHLIFV